MFCEWRSGLGLAVDVAEMLGHQAMGIELDAVLAENSRTLLTDHGLSAEIETGTYLDRIDAADYFDTADKNEPEALAEFVRRSKIG